MSRFQAAKPGLLKPALVCVAALLLLAGAVHGWLCDLSLAGQLWPSDVNVKVVTLLGGMIQTDAVGNSQPVLGIVAVWLRLLGLTSVLAGLSIFRHRHRDRATRLGNTGAAFWKTTAVCCVGAVWWLLRLLGDLGVQPTGSFCIGVLSLSVMLMAGMYCWIWWQTIFSIGDADATTHAGETVGGVAVDIPAQTSSQARPVMLLMAAMLCWIAVSFWMNFCLYQQLLIPHGDSAMYEEHLWNVWHGKGFRSYLDQGLFLGEHIQVIHLLLLPLHMLWPSHLLLELTESIALGSCAVPIYLIAKRHTQNPWAAALLGVAWLFYFPMHFLDIAIDQKTFRPIALAVPFLFWLIEFAERRRFGMATVCLLVALSAKEDVALIAFPLLTVLALMIGSHGDRVNGETPVPCSDRTARRWLMGLSVFSAVYLVAAVLLVIPAFRSGEHVHYSRYFGDLGGTPGELVKTAITHPLKVIGAALSVRTLVYVCVFLAPLAFFPLRRPWLLASGVLTFGMLSLLQFGGAETGELPPVPYHHFHAPLLPVVFWVAIVAIGHAKPLYWLSFGGAQSSMHGRAALVLCCCAATAVTNSLMPCGFSFWSQVSPFGLTHLYLPADGNQQIRAAMVQNVTQQIPLTARVASTDYIHTRLTHCERSYDYSKYLRAVNDYQPGVPSDTDYIVIDTGHRYSDIKRAADIPELQGDVAEWELLPDTTDGMFLILKRKPAMARPTD